jgi:hypothetical protein
MLAIVCLFFLFLQTLPKTMGAFACLEINQSETRIAYGSHVC